jgi:hypothetical protein
LLVVRDVRLEGRSRQGGSQEKEGGHYITNEN